MQERTKIMDYSFLSVDIYKGLSEGKSIQDLSTDLYNSLNDKQRNINSLKDIMDMIEEYQLEWFE